jgi:hypothetical protein
MSRPSKAELLNLSIPKIKGLMAARTPLARLEARKANLEAQISRIEADLEKLVRGFTLAPTRKSTRQTRGRQGRPGRQGKAARKAGAVKAAARPRQTLQDVVVAVIRQSGGKMAFQDILATIQANKLYHSKSRNFANVLRRTVSISPRVKRAGRGIYRL